MNTLLMKFIDPSETFTLGFECGQLWEKIKEGETLECYPVHSDNEEQIKLICEAFGVDYTIAYASEGWSHLWILPRQVAIDRTKQLSK